MYVHQKNYTNTILYTITNALIRTVSGNVHVARVDEKVHRGSGTALGINMMYPVQIPSTYDVSI